MTKTMAGRNVWRLVLTTAIVGGILATVLSAFSFVALQALGALVTHTQGFESAPALLDVIKGTVLFCALTVVWSGPYGVLVGAAGGLVLHFRSGKVQNRRRLFIEASIFGVLAAVANPFYEALVNWIPPRRLMHYYFIPQWVGSFVGCVAISLLCVTLMRKRLLANNH